VKLNVEKLTTPLFAQLVQFITVVGQNPNSESINNLNIGVCLARNPADKIIFALTDM